MFGVTQFDKIEILNSEYFQGSYGWLGFELIGA